MSTCLSLLGIKARFPLFKELSFHLDGFFLGGSKIDSPVSSYLLEAVRVAQKIKVFVFVLILNIAICLSLILRRLDMTLFSLKYHVLRA